MNLHPVVTLQKEYLLTSIADEIVPTKAASHGFYED